MRGRILFLAFVSSAIVAVPTSLASMTFVGGSGNFWDVFAFPGFWIYYGRALLWLLAANFLASVLTTALVFRKQGRD